MVFRLFLFFLFTFFLESSFAAGEGVPHNFVFTQIYNVILFVGLGVYLLRPKARVFFKKRHDDFLEKIHRVQNLKQEALNEKKRIKAKILELEKNWEKSFQKVKQESLEKKEETLKEAQKQATYIEEEALKTVALTKKNLNVVLKKELFDKAFKEAMKSIPKKMDESKREEFFMEFLEGLKS